MHDSLNKVISHRPNSSACSLNSELHRAAAADSLALAEQIAGDFDRARLVSDTCLMIGTKEEKVFFRKFVEISFLRLAECVWMDGWADFYLR